MLTKRTLMCFAIILCIAAAGGGPVAASLPSHTPTTAAHAPTLVPTELPTAAAYPLAITDSAERRVSIARQPQKVVSLSPSVTEIHFALGVAKQLVAVD